jgi:plasmid stability protein
MKTKPKRPVRFNFWLPVDLRDRLRERAARNDRTVTAEILRAIRAHLGGGGES